MVPSLLRCSHEHLADASGTALMRLGMGACENVGKVNAEGYSFMRTKGVFWSVVGWERVMYVIVIMSALRDQVVISPEISIISSFVVIDLVTRSRE